MTFSQLTPGDLFRFAVNGEAVPETPSYIAAEHGVAYKSLGGGNFDQRPRAIGQDIEVVCIGHMSLRIGRDIGVIPPELLVPIELTPCQDMGLRPQLQLFSYVPPSER